MKKNLKHYAWMLVVLFVFCALSGYEVQAASKASKAKMAYKSFLTDIYKKKDFRQLKDMQYGDIYFVVKDFSGDKVPDMLIKHTYCSPCEYYLYTYRNGQVKKLKSLSYYVNGEPWKFYPKKHVIMATEGDSWDADTIYYKVTSKKARIVAREKNGKYYVNGKVVSYSKYTSYVKSLTKGKAYSFEKGIYKFRKNTAKNRKKYIK